MKNVFLIILLHLSFQLTAQRESNQILANVNQHLLATSMGSYRTDFTKVSMVQTYTSRGQGEVTFLKPGKLFNKQLKNAYNMGISLIFYSISGKEKLSEYTDLNQEINNAKETEVDLEKMYSDFAVVLTKSVDFEEHEETLPFKLIFGNSVVDDIHVDCGQVNGFISPKEVIEIDHWIKQNKLDTEAGFLAYFDALDEDVKEELDGWGTPETEILFEIFKEVTTLYHLSAQNKRSIVMCAR